MTNPLLKSEYAALGDRISILRHRLTRPRNGPWQKAELLMKDELERLMTDRNRLCQELFGVDHGTRDKELRFATYK